MAISAPPTRSGTESRSRNEILLRYAPWGIILFCLAFAGIFLRFAPDDAYITFRYAKNMAEGYGPVWNPGESAVEGYSTFLWMFLMTIPYHLGISGLLFAQIVGLAFMGATLWFSLQLFRQHFSQRTSLLLLTLLGSNFTFMAFAVSGMETHLFTFLVTFNLWLLVKLVKPQTPINRLHGYLIGISLALMAMARPEGILLAGIFGIAHFIKVRGQAHDVSLLIFTAIGFTWVFGAFLGWRFAIYDNLLPNTFYAKTSNPSFIKGALYAGQFFLTYFALGFLPTFAAKWKLGKPALSLWVSLIIIGSWSLYLILIGGDFMEFRMWVPIMPMLWLVVGHFVFRPAVSPSLQTWAFGLFVACNLFQLLVFDGLTTSGTVISHSRLDWEVSEPHRGLADLGKKLKQLFGDDSKVRLAVTQAGALPYYSELPCTDVLGLNDAWVARNGRIQSSDPGHHRIANLQYLWEQEVNLITGRVYFGSQRPLPMKIDFKDRKWMTYAHLEESDVSMPDQVQGLLLIPLDNGDFWATLYLHKHDEVESLVAKKAAILVPIINPNKSD